MLKISTIYGSIQQIILVIGRGQKNLFLGLPLESMLIKAIPQYCEYGFGRTK